MTSYVPSIPQGQFGNVVDNYIGMPSGRTTGGPTNPGTQLGPNIWGDYHLTPAPQYQLHNASTDTFHLPTSFLDNTKFVRVVQQMINEGVEGWIFYHLLPLTSAETLPLDQAMSFPMTQWIADSHVLSRLAPETHGPVPTSRVESNRGYMEQHGMSFVIDQGFATTSRGQTEFLIKIRQIRDALTRTLVLEALRALLNTKNAYGDRLRTTNTVLRSPDDYFRPEHTHFGILNKQGIDGLVRLFAIITKAMSTYNAHPDTIVVAPCTKLLGNLEKELSTKSVQYVITGREKDSFETREVIKPLVGTAALFELSPITMKGVDRDLASLSRTVTIGQYALATDHTHGHQNYQRHWRDIMVFDFPSNNFQTLSFRDMLWACGRWTEDGSIDREVLSKFVPRSRIESFPGTDRSQEANDAFIWTDRRSGESGITYFLGQIDLGKWSDNHFLSVVHSFSDALAVYGFSREDEAKLSEFMSIIDGYDRDCTLDENGLLDVDVTAAPGAAAPNKIAWCTWGNVQHVLPDLKPILRRLYRACKAVSPMAFSHSGSDDDQSLSDWFDSVVMPPGRVAETTGTGKEQAVRNGFDLLVPGNISAQAWTTLKRALDTPVIKRGTVAFIAIANIFLETGLTVSDNNNVSDAEVLLAERARYLFSTFSYMFAGDMEKADLERELTSLGVSNAAVGLFENNLKRLFPLADRQADFAKRARYLVSEAAKKHNSSASHFVGLVAASATKNELLLHLKAISDSINGPVPSRTPTRLVNIGDADVAALLTNAGVDAQGAAAVKAKLREGGATPTVGSLIDAIRQTLGEVAATTAVDALVTAVVGPIPGVSSPREGVPGIKKRRVRLPSSLLPKDAIALSRGYAEGPIGSSARMGAFTHGGAKVFGVKTLFESIVSSEVGSDRFRVVTGGGAPGTVLFNENMAHRLATVATKIVNPVHRVAALTLLLTPVHRDSLIALHDSHCRIPYNAIVFRPFIELETTSAIFAKAGRETGMTLIRNPTFKVGEAVQEGLFHGKYTVYVGAVVLDPTKVIVVHDIAVLSVRGGYGIRLADKYRNDQTFGERGDIFAHLISANHSRLPQTIDLHGRFSQAVPDNSPEGETHYEGHQYFTTYWRLDQQSHPLSYSAEDAPYGLASHKVNSLCTRMTYVTADPTRNGSLKNVIQGGGHMGTFEGPGASTAIGSGGRWMPFAGRGIFEQSA